MSGGETGNRILILFASGESSRVHLSLHPGRQDRNRPADAYVVTGGGLSRSARRAAEAVYNWLSESGRNPDQFVAAFDIEGSDTDMRGESAGLAFALALAARLLNRENLAVAATGEIAGSTYPALVAAVDSVDTKLRAAARLLPAGSICCYPAANEAELTIGTKRLLEQRGIRPVPVESVAEALDYVVPVGVETTPRSTRRPPGASLRPFLLLSAVVACCVAVGALWWMFTRDDVVSTPPAGDNVVSPSAVIRQDPAFLTAPPPADSSAAGPGVKDHGFD